MTNWITGYNNDLAQAAAIPIMTKNFQQAAESIGFQVLNYTKFPGTDSYPKRRQNLLDTLIGQIQPGDTIVVQFPMFIGGVIQMDLIDQLVAKPDVKVLAIIHDVPTWMIATSDGAYDLHDNWLNALRKVDGIIAANTKGAAKLRADGVTAPIVSLTVGDYLYHGPLHPKCFQKKLYYVGGRNVEGLDYHAATPLNLYTGHVSPEVAANPSVNWHGRHPSDVILSSLDGGFGIVVSDNIKEEQQQNFRYYTQFNSPTKLSFYLAAGLPIVTMSRTPHAQWVKDRGIGLVVDDLNEIDHRLQQITESQYNAMLTAIQPWQTAISNGFFVKRALLAALGAVNLGITHKLAIHN
ncbi:MAG: beta-1,6-galactofuranosyltransferase [Lactobacillus sp.]|nr:MAG: beta-1,6-galactofuranosyltransferase [Lactobacillus sp.]